MKLISMTDFVLEQSFELNKSDDIFIENVIRYANFLKQPLKLSMFVPCDDYWNILYDKKAKKNVLFENVLFEGFELHHQDKYSILLVNDNQELTIEFQENTIFYLDEYIVKNIEDLCFYNKKEQTHIILTESAIEQIVL